VKSQGVTRLREALGTLISREIGVLTNAIAFNFLLCLFPLLVFVAALSRQLPGIGRRAGTGLLLVLQELIPFGHQAMVESVRGLTKTAAGLQLLSLLLIVWGSSGIFMPVEMALNRAWGGHPNRNFFKSKVLAAFMTLTGGLLGLLSIAITVAARTYGRDWPLIVRYSSKAAALMVSYLLFFLIYRLVPEAPVGSKTALRAALIAGTAWEVAKYVFVARLPGMGLEAFYGPLAFSVSLVLWAYVSSLVLVFGALMVATEAPKAPKARALRRAPR
jgi:membrane protein/epoxyqueuosine reductase